MELLYLGVREEIRSCKRGVESCYIGMLERGCGAITLGCREEVYSCNIGMQERGG